MSLLSILFRRAVLEPEPEPEIPTEMDDWDEAFKAATGAYPPFSRLHLDKIVAARAQLRYTDTFSLQGAGIVDGGYERARSGERLYQEQRAYDIQYTTMAKRLNMHPCDSPAILVSILGQRPGSSRKVPPA